MTGDAAAAQLQTQYQVSVHGAAPASQLWLTTTGNSFPFAVLYVHDRVVVGVEHSLLDREIESSDDLFNALLQFPRSWPTNIGQPANLTPALLIWPMLV